MKLLTLSLLDRDLGHGAAAFHAVVIQLVKISGNEIIRAHRNAGGSDDNIS